MRTTPYDDRDSHDLIRSVHMSLDLSLLMAEGIDEETAWRHLSALDELAAGYCDAVGLDDWGEEGVALDRETYAVRVLAKTSELLCALKLTVEETLAQKLLAEFAEQMNLIQERIFLCLMWVQEDLQEMRFN